MTGGVGAVDWTRPERDIFGKDVSSDPMMYRSIFINAVSLVLGCCSHWEMVVNIVGFDLRASESLLKSGG
jgi:hypothetical protein